MNVEEFILKYFAEVYKTNDNKHFYINEYANSDMNPVDIKSIQDDNEKINFYCNKNHLISTRIEDLPDIIYNGCPFCKKTADERVVKYLREYESLGYVIDRLPNTLGKYNNLKFEFKAVSTGDLVEASPWIININILKGKEDRYKFVANRKDVTKEICNILEELWVKSFFNNIEDNKLIVVSTDRNREELEHIKLNIDDMILTRCKKCGNIQMISAARLFVEDCECTNCKDIILKRKPVKTFNYKLESTNDLCFPSFLKITHPYTLYKLRNKVRKEGIKLETSEKTNNSGS